MMKVNDCKLIELPKIVDVRGNLSIIEQFKQIPFDIKRVHWIYDVPGFDVEVDDGEMKQTVQLSRSYYGLYIPKGIWRAMNNFSTNSLALVLSSTDYDEKDYMYDYQEFINWRGGQE